MLVNYLGFAEAFGVSLNVNKSGWIFQEP